MAVPGRGRVGSLPKHGTLAQLLRRAALWSGEENNHTCFLKNVQLAASYWHVFLFQLNPTKEKVFEILGKIYAEFFSMFEFDSFHMGGNNVKSACWKTNPDILDYMDNDPKLRSKDDNG